MAKAFHVCGPGLISMIIFGMSLSTLVNRISKNKELYYDFLTGSSDIADQAFGYTARYAEYKFAPDEIHGDLKTSLSFWHQGRLFDNLPALNAEFIKCSPSDRVFAVQDAVSNQKVIADLWLDVKAVRPMSKYGQPRLS